MLAIPLLQKIVGGIALAIIAILALSLTLEKRHAGKLQAQVISLSAQLEAISTARNKQLSTTVDNIAKVRIDTHAAGKRAERVEAAPLLGNCVTPEAVLSADL